MEYRDYVYEAPNLEKVLEGIIAFLVDTPPFCLTQFNRFVGVGVYSLYYNGDYEYYDFLHGVNWPIYTGKAVPTGWRQGRTTTGDAETKLYTRLREHRRSIEQCPNLLSQDFFCRLAILKGSSSDLITAVENAVIRRYRPLWNSIIDGFGNHDPGSGRYNQAPSEWDTLHPGRSWAEKLTGQSPEWARIIEKIRQYKDSLKGSWAAEQPKLLS